MTIQFVDVPPPVCEWYAEKADEMGMTTLDLMRHILTLYPATVTRPRQPGAFTLRETGDACPTCGAELYDPAETLDPDNWPFGGGY